MRIWVEFRRLFGLFALSGFAPASGAAQSLEENVTLLLPTSCVRCLGARTVTPLSFVGVAFDLTDQDTFRVWGKVYDRLVRGEMPPASAPQPDSGAVEVALGALKSALVDADLSVRGGQRTPLGRLSTLWLGATGSSS